MAKKKKGVSLGCNDMKCGNGCGFYLLGFIGALVYYIQTTTGFSGTVVGILKAIVWPAFLVYRLMGGGEVPVGPI